MFINLVGAGNQWILAILKISPFPSKLLWEMTPFSPFLRFPTEHFTILEEKID